MRMIEENSRVEEPHTHDTTDRASPSEREPTIHLMALPQIVEILGKKEDNTQGENVTLPEPLQSRTDTDTVPVTDEHTCIPITGGLDSTQVYPCNSQEHMGLAH